MKFRIDHIDKIEGHMGFEAALFEGKIHEAFLDVIEGARMIEGMVAGRPYEDIPIITSRICGICPVVHNLASIKALEAALGIKVEKIVTLFRKLMLLGEIIESHMLHIFFLSAPDFLGSTNDFDIIKKYPKEAEAAFLARDWATNIIKIVGGRAVHPIASEVGGFKILPDKRQLEEILEKTEETMKAAKIIHKLVSKIKYPQLNFEIRPISLANHEYEFYDGEIISGQGLKTTLQKFYSSIEELQKPKSPVKETSLYKRHYLVGALARLLNQNQYLNKEAKKLFSDLPQEKIKSNPFYNLTAQSIEVVHCIEDIEKIIKEIFALNIPREARHPSSLYELRRTGKITLRAGSPPHQSSGVRGDWCGGEGLGTVEAPRGTLIHYYKLDENGKVVDSNIITPTAQFLNDLDHSARAYLEQIKNLPEAERAHKIKSLVRAYDPCISCATH